MPIEVTDLNEQWQAETLAYLRRSPYRNAMPLSNVTQLRQHCDVVVAHSDGIVQGMASHYRTLPFLGLAFVSELSLIMPDLIGALADRVPKLRNASVTTIIPEQRLAQLQYCAVIEHMEIEHQLVVEPETLRPSYLPEVRRLSSADLPALNELAAIGGLVAWRPDVITHGPAFGAFVDNKLVAMAATHFATTDVIEIGNIVTHPDYRRRGFASACTSALAQACFSLAPRVYLMVMEHNQAAYTAYRALGFWPAERFCFAEFRLTV